MSTDTPHLSDLSDKSTGEKKTIGSIIIPSFSDPLELFHKLSSKRTNPINPIITNEPDKSQPPLPDREPTFTTEEATCLDDFYCSRPRAERLSMHRRSLYARADKGWSWDACSIQAYREAWAAAGRPQGPFVMANDGFNDTRLRTLNTETEEKGVICDNNL